MKKNLLFIIITVLFASCNGVGSLEGNVYWKYNNYVGNKPDAGSSAFLYSLQQDSNPLEETADLEGNFKFDKVSSGDYLLIVKSKNTTSSFYDMLKELLNNSSDLKKIFNVDIYSLDKEKVRNFLYKDSLYIETLVHSNDNSLSQQNLQKQEDFLDYTAGEILKKIPIGNKLADLISRKIKIKNVAIKKDRNDKEVIDFGITYY